MPLIGSLLHSSSPMILWCAEDWEIPPLATEPPMGQEYHPFKILPFLKYSFLLNNSGVFLALGHEQRSVLRTGGRKELKIINVKQLI